MKNHIGSFSIRFCIAFLLAANSYAGSAVDNPTKEPHGPVETGRVFVGVQSSSRSNVQVTVLSMNSSKKTIEIKVDVDYGVSKFSEIITLSAADLVVPDRGEIHPENVFAFEASKDLRYRVTQKFILKGYFEGGRSLKHFVPSAFVLKHNDLNNFRNDSADRWEIFEMMRDTLQSNTLIQLKRAHAKVACRGIFNAITLH